MIELILLQTVDHRDVLVNPAYVISITEPKDKGGFASPVQCVVSFVDGKFISLLESCAIVRKKLEGK